jgi:hypothetical protein
VHIDPIHARRTGRVLELPSRPDVLAQVQPLLPGPATLRLHYLDTGLEVEVDLHAALAPADVARLEHTVRDNLARSTRVNQVQIRCTY